MNAEEFLRIKTVLCKPLSMRLTPQACSVLRTRKGEKNENGDELSPPPQCHGCQGLSVKNHIGDVNEMVPTDKAEKFNSTGVTIMSKNKLTDLNDHLFAQLERLSDPWLESFMFLKTQRARSSIKNAPGGDVCNCHYSKRLVDL